MSQKNRKKLPHLNVSAGIIRKGEKILIAQRATADVFGNLWEFPGGKQEEGETLKECLHREILEELGVEIVVGEQTQKIRHAYSDFEITLHVFECEWYSGEPKRIECADFRWIVPQNLTNFSFPATDLKIVDKILRKSTAHIQRANPLHNLDSSS